MSKLIILNQKIIDWEVKGEIQNNYFNPENKPEKIIILSLTDSRRPSNSSLKKLCGTKNFQYINISSFLLTNNLFKYFLPIFLYKFLIFKELKFLNLTRPRIVYSIGDGFSGFIAGIISKKLACRLVISIHSYINILIYIKYFTFKEKIIYLLNLRFRRKSHNLANQINIVYKIIEQNIDLKNKNKIKIKYNNIKIKNSYKKKVDVLKNHLNLVFIGRLIKGKSPINIIYSIKDLNFTTLTVFGDGPERRKIEFIIKKYELENKIFLKGFKDNEYIVKKLNTFDAFIGYHKYYEFPKTIIEALLVGIPIILNSSPSKDIYEYKNLKILWTNDDINSYKEIINKLKKGKFNLKSIQEKNNFEIKKILQRVNND